MGEFYRGIGFGRTILGSCENGSIYKGIGLYREKIGTYRKGYVDALDGTTVGSYENGRIYMGFWNSSVVGTYDGSTIYIRQGLFDHALGSYEGGGAEAAAYLLLMRDQLPSYLDDPYAQQDSPGTGSYVTESSPAASESGGGAGGYFVGKLLGFLGMLLVPALAVLIWVLVFKHTAPAEMPYLIITICAIAAGLFLSIRVLGIGRPGVTYLITVAVSSAVYIVSFFVLDPSNVTFGRLLLVPVGMALFSLVPTGLAYVLVWLIATVRAKVKTKKEAAQEKAPQAKLKTQDQAQPKPQAQAQPKPQAQAQPKPQAQAQPKPQAQAQPKPQAQAQPKPQAQAQTKPQAQAQTKPQAQAQPKPQAQARPKPQAQAQPKTYEQVKSKPQIQTQPRPQGQAQSKTQEQARSKAQAQPQKAQEQAKPKRQTQPTPEPKSEPRSKAQMKPKPQQQGRSESVSHMTQEEKRALAKALVRSVSQAKPQAQARPNLVQPQPQVKEQSEPQVQPKSNDLAVRNEKKALIEVLARSLIATKNE